MYSATCESSKRKTFTGVRQFKGMRAENVNFQLWVSFSQIVAEYLKKTKQKNTIKHENGVCVHTRWGGDMPPSPVPVWKSGVPGSSPGL